MKNFLATFDWRVDSKGIKPAKDESPFEAAYWQTMPYRPAGFSRRLVSHYTSLVVLKH